MNVTKVDVNLIKMFYKVLTYLDKICYNEDMVKKDISSKYVF